MAAGPATLPPEELAELRRTEREVMESILGSDFCVLQPTAWQSVGVPKVETYEVVLRPEDEDQKEHVAVVLQLALGGSYPNTPPTVHVRAHDTRTCGVTPDHLAALFDVLNAKARTLTGTEMVWELVSTGQEFISAHNTAPVQDSSTAKLSLEERMRQRALVAQQDEARKKQQGVEARSQAEQQRSRELAALIESETRRQKEAIREERRRLRDAPVSAPLLPMSEAGASAEMRNADQEAFGVVSVVLSDAIRIRRGPFLEASALARSYLAYPDQLAPPDTEVLWALDVVPITAPYYANASGAKKLADVEAELAAVQRLSTAALAPMLGFARVAVPTPDLPQASALCIVRGGAGAMRMSRLLAQCHALAWPRVRHHVATLLDGVATLHQAGLSHRGVALDSILLVNDEVALSGAAYARHLWDLHRSNALNAIIVNEVTVPEAWQAPEAVTHPLLYPASRDIWDIGRCACQMLFGADVIHNYTSPEQVWESMHTSETRSAATFLAKLLHRSARSRASAANLRTALYETSASEWHVDRSGLSPLEPTPRLLRSATLGMEPRSSQEADNNLTGPVGSFWQLRNVREPTYRPVSRYLSDFEEVEFLGRGAFGVVVKAKNKLDGRFYAVKKVQLSSSAGEEERTMREIMTLSRLDHPHIVRYVTCWIEETQAANGSAFGIDASSDFAMTTSQHMDSSALGALLPLSSRSTRAPFGRHDDFLSSDPQDSLSDLGSFVEFGRESGAAHETPTLHSGRWSTEDASSENDSSEASLADDPHPSTMLSSSQDRGVKRVLYIQMEYVENQTLGDAIERGLSVDEAWHIFRQMLEALAHIASVGIIHRDLKPSNVLMYTNGDIKIGDFGLATTNLQTIETGLRESILHEQSGDDTELTSGLGTFSYIAPEVLGKQGLSTRYNFKVDMFSLGIIFFEMLASQRCYKTVMERNQLLRDLRQPSIQFPASWDETQFPAQTEIIRQLLSHDPSRRPSPMTMLHSPLLPPKMQDEYVEELVRLAASPASVHRHQLIASLFSKTDADDIRDYTFDTGAQSDEDDVLVGVVCQHLRNVFQKRGAVPVHPPLLFPSNDVYHHETNVVKLLDKTGNVVLLPFDLTVPFARICARSGHRRIKRFDIADVYRENLLAGGQPRAVLAASYDIVSPELDYAAEAELFDVLSDILSIPGLAGEPWEMDLGHETITRVLLRRFPERIRPALQSILPMLHNRATEARAKQQLAQLGMSAAHQDDLESFLLRGDVEATIQQLETLLTPPEREEVALALGAMREIAELARYYGIRHPIHFTPFLSHGLQRYQHGAILSVVKHAHTKHREVLAVGGRYDSLLARFAYPTTSSVNKPQAHAAGIQIAVGCIVSALAAYQQDQIPRYLSRPEEERTLGPWTPRRCGTSAN